VREIAGQINSKIGDQGDKLDSINKQMGKQVDDVKTANKELVATREITASRNKCACYLTMLAIICALILGLSIYYLFAN